MNRWFSRRSPAPGSGGSDPKRYPWAVRAGSLLVLGVLFVLTCGPPVPGAEKEDGAIREYQTAVGLLKEGELRLARRQYRNFLREYPESNRRSRAYFGLAETYYLEEKYDSAARYYQRSLSDPGLPERYRKTALQRGFQSARRTGEGGRVRTFARRVAREGSISLADTVQRRVYRVLEEEADTEVSLEYARDRLEHHPESGFWKYTVAVRLAEVGQYEEALRLLDGLGDPGSSLRYDATYTKAEIQLQQGELEEAEYRYRFLLERGSHVQKARYGLAWVAIKRGDHDRARRLLERITREAEDPTRINAARDLARLARRDDHRDRALDWYFRAVEWADGSLEKELIEEAKPYAKEQ